MGRGQGTEGFTLVELLVTLGLGLIVLGATVVVLTTHLRSTAAAEQAQRVRDAANRLNYFLQVEAGEASSISTNTAIGSSGSEAACTSAPSSQSLFTLNIPLPTGTLAAISGTLNPDGTISGSGNFTPPTTPIHYYISSGDLMRCGPQINQNGSLNLIADASTSSISYTQAVISSGTTLTLQACQGATTSSRIVAYQAAFSEATSSGSASYQPPCEIARAKSFFVVDPP